MSGDFAVSQTIETVEQEGLPRFFGQTFKQPGDSLEYLQRGVNGFRAGNARLVGMQRQRIQISAFDLAAAGTVNQQTGGRGRQKSARFLEVERLGQGKNSNESIMSKIGCTLRAAQFFSAASSATTSGGRRRARSFVGDDWRHHQRRKSRAYVKASQTRKIIINAKDDIKICQQQAQE